MRSGFGVNRGHVTRLKSQTTEDCMLQRREKIGMGFHPFFQKEKGKTLHKSCNQMLLLSYLSQTKILNKPFKSKNGEDIIGLPLISFWDKCLLMKSMISDGKMDMGPGRLVNLAWKPEEQYSLGTKSWRFSSVLFACRETRPSEMHFMAWENGMWYFSVQKNWP